MTKAEIEEAQALLAAGGDLRAWLIQHCDELVRIADESRWRKTSEEPPPASVWIAARGRISAVMLSRTVRNTWIDAHGASATPPEEWRPLTDDYWKKG